MSSSNTTSRTNQQSKGIDIQQALSILSERSSSHPESSSDPDNHHGGCGCHGSHAPENAPTMGQTIDLMASSPQPQQEQEESKEDQEKKALRIQHERAKRQAQIQQELKGMTDQELLQAVLNVQQDRVATYRDYEA
jgi:hypothetical protein